MRLVSQSVSKVLASGCSGLAMFIGIYTLEESLSVKGYYAVCALFLTMSSFVLQKVVRDNLEDGYGIRKRNTAAFTFMAWSSFALALLGMWLSALLI
jgi:uncharacterized membrane protein YiaA